MVKEVYKNIYVNEVVLPKNPLKALKCHIILGRDKNLIIDTGFNNEECRNEFFRGIRELNMDLSKTELFITHLHADHSGLASDLSKLGIKVYASKKDGDLINRMATEKYWNEFEEKRKLFDLEEDGILISDNPGFRFCSKEPVDFTYVKEGDEINVGDYNFKVVDIPGHTPGQIGLYETTKKIFFSGDHILNNITPNITFWNFEMDSLNVYFDSLAKIYRYDIEHLFTAHREDVGNYKERIEELIKHHHARLEEILNLLKEKKLTVKEVASKMKWQIRCNSWEEFPKPQKWFATGEVMAHLEYLVNNGVVKKEKNKGILYYSIV